MHSTFQLTEVQYFDTGPEAATPIKRNYDGSELPKFVNKTIISDM